MTEVTFLLRRKRWEGPRKIDTEVNFFSFFNNFLFLLIFILGFFGGRGSICSGGHRLPWPPLNFATDNISLEPYISGLSACTYPYLTNYNVATYKLCPPPSTSTPYFVYQFQEQSSALTSDLMKRKRLNRPPLIFLHVSQAGKVKGEML